ncbi:pyridoxal phosphate-dependent aminotransferase [Maribacter algarum]|uniref:cysteine-S-conjugate beta-lyase n=1 Tax=Maribacter algarum (ex Zhang et al. 2020) TaxID=2578118 RepID=A0A5S3PHY5_9FLAO|nr:MalY/PatB family protein [Maribacter algarum]TMM53857.1 pyridoxal phosphate-dependent aminotransferase [Maribacter algarum]
MKYNFDEIIDRRNTNAMSLNGYRNYLFGGSDAFESDYSDEDLIPMWIADMEFKSPPAVSKAVKDRAEHGIFGYSQIFDPNYKQAFLNWSKLHYDWEFKPNHLVTSHGVIPALFSLVKYVCAPDEKVLIMTPSYAFFKLATEGSNRELITSDLINENGNYTIDFEDFRRKAEDEKVTLTIFCNPHNPTGRVWSDDELRQLGEICLENDVMIISDEIHCDLLRTEKTFTPLARLFPESDQIITCMAPSKTFNMAGFMIANIIIPNDELRTLWQQKEIPIDNPLSIAAAQAVYSHGNEWLSELKEYLDGNFEFLKDYLSEYLPKAIFKIPDATYLAWVNIGAYLPDEENLTLFFANKAGVLLEGDNMFVANGAGHIRLNLACPRARLHKGLDRIAKAIRNSTT